MAYLKNIIVLLIVYFVSCCLCDSDNSGYDDGVDDIVQKAERIESKRSALIAQYHQWSVTRDRTIYEVERLIEDVNFWHTTSNLAQVSGHACQLASFYFTFGVLNVIGAAVPFGSYAGERFIMNPSKLRQLENIVERDQRETELLSSLFEEVFEDVEELQRNMEKLKGEFQPSQQDYNELCDFLSDRLPPLLRFGKGPTEIGHDTDKTVNHYALSEIVNAFTLAVQIGRELRNILLYDDTDLAYQIQVKVLYVLMRQHSTIKSKFDKLK